MALVPNEENLKTLSFFLEKTLDDGENRQRAEAELAKFKGKPGFASLLLHLLRQSIPLHIARSCASYLKNYVSYAWNEANVIPDAEKEEIKRIFPTLMFTLPVQLHKQAGSILVIISKADFPERWPSLLPDLVEKLANTQDLKAMQAILKILKAVLKPYRHAVESNEVNARIVMICEFLGNPLLAFFKMVCQQIAAQAPKGDLLLGFINCAKLVTDIFHTLCSVDLPFEDTLNDWMGGFRALLTLDCQAPNCLEDEDDEDRPGAFHALQTSILHVTYLFAEKYEEDFKPFLQTFVQDSWTILRKTSNKPKYDSLVAAAIQFLTNVAKSIYYELFKDPAALSEICQHIVVPNVKLRDDDKMLFEDDPLAYVNREIEGTTEESRRGAAVELVKGLRKNFEKEVTEIFAKDITSLLGEYRADSKKWASKDAAIYLITALAVQTKSRDGVTSTNQLVPIADFFRGEIIPELEAPLDRQAILQASALNFTANFRRSFGPQEFQLVFPLFIKFLGSKSEAVRSLSAYAMERFLSITETTPQGPVPRFGRNLLQPFVGDSLKALFTLLTSDSSENPYTMRAISRILTVAEGDAVLFLGQAVQSMCARLAQIYRQPANPIFGHYLWDALSACLLNALKSKPHEHSSILDHFEDLLFPIFEKILTEPDADTFIPYVLQLMAFLIERRGALGADPLTSLPHSKRAGTLKASYQPLLKRLTEAALWESPGNVPALTRLLQAYIEHDPQYVLSSESLLRILGVFQRLIASKITDYLGFYILESLISSFPLAALDPYFPEIFRIIFVRLSNLKTPQLVKSFLVFCCTFIVLHGPSPLITRINSVQSGIFLMVLQNVWLPTLTSINGRQERKRAAIASTRLLSEAPEMFQPPLIEQWPNILNVTVLLLEKVDLPQQQSSSSSSSSSSVQELEEIEVMSTNFSGLRNAPKPEFEVTSEIQDASSFLVASLKQFSSSHPGQLPPLMAKVDPQVGQQLLNYASQAGIPQPIIQ